MVALHTRLGLYDVLAPLGAGGMGEVWRARDTIVVMPDWFEELKAKVPVPQ